MNRSNTIIIVSIALAAIVATAWMTKYEYKRGSDACIFRIDKWTGEVQLGCPWKSWIPVGEKQSASEFLGNSGVRLKPFHGTLDQPNEASGDPVPQNATDDELMKVFDAPAAAASSAQQIGEAAAEEARNAAAAAAQDAIRAAKQ